MDVTYATLIKLLIKIDDITNMKIKSNIKEFFFFFRNKHTRLK